MARVCLCPQGHRWDPIGKSPADSFSLMCPYCGETGKTVTVRDSNPAARGAALTAVLLLVAGGAVAVFLLVRASEQERRLQLRTEELERRLQHEQALHAQARAAAGQRADLERGIPEQPPFKEQPDLVRLQQQLQGEQQGRLQAEQRAREAEQQARAERAQRTALERTLEGKVKAEVQKAKVALEKDAALAKKSTAALKRAEGELYSARVALADFEFRSRNFTRAAQYLKECSPDFRNWEWYYLNSVCGPEQSSKTVTLTGTPEAAVFSRDGSRVAFLSANSSISLRDVATGRSILSISGAKENVRTIAFSPDGESFAAAGVSLRLRDLSPRKRPVVTKNYDAIHTLEYSPDGQRLLLGGANGVIRVCAAEGGAELAAFKQAAPVRAVTFSPDGRLAATAAGGEVVLWDPASGKEVARTAGEAGTLSALAFAQGGKHLVGVADGKLYFWELAGSALRADGPPAPLPPGAVRSLAVSADGRRVYAALDTGLMCLDRAAGLSFPFQGYRTPILAVALSGDGTTLWTAAADKTVTAWPLPSRPQALAFRAHAGGTAAVAFSPDDTTLATCGGDRFVRLWAADTGRELLSLSGHTRPVARVAFAAEGSRLVSVSEPCANAGGIEVKVWNRAGKREEFGMVYPAATVSVALSKDGRRLALTSPGAKVRVFDVITGAEEPQKTPSARALSAGIEADGLALSPDGTRLALARRSGVTVIELDDEAGTVERRRESLMAKEEPPFELVWGADGTFLALLTKHKTLFWKLGPLKAGTTLLKVADAWCAAFSPDGKRLATLGSTNSVLLWEVNSSRLLLELPGPGGPPKGVAFSSDQHLLAAGFADGQVFVWDGTPVPAKGGPPKGERS